MQLPLHLEERWCRTGGAVNANGHYVLYWMRTAVRAHENPALDAALVLGESLGIPVVVYHALSERYPYASDRHHTFILEGARDVAAELRARGIPYALHVEREGHRGPHLKTLGARASVVVTEEMPVSPLREWTERLAASLPATPVWTFDTACVVPMTLTRKPYTRAFKYRDAVKTYRQERIGRFWEEQSVVGDMTLPELPFEPVDVERVSIRELVAECRIDHSIAPVSHSHGGSVAGYERWERFKARGLKAYGRTRNDPLKDGVSRMSAYLHYGHVSAFRLARESVEAKAEKYVDELVTWRELAYTWCYYEGDLDTVDALPSWALETWRSGERDRRPALLSWETLARARTGDALWDACQNSLLIHGELHNNVRMTWGKAFAKWTPSVERALALTLDLNHRYALDGRDPSSYGGILWCYGQFDRPFTPAKPITGVIRPRPTEQHASRLDVRAYAAKTGRPLVHKSPRIAIVGAGVAGTICARTLKDHGVSVTVFDKGRGAGGRMSTRRDEPYAFDHGAAYFVARDLNFRRCVESWVEDGVAARWNGVAAVYRDGEIAVDEAPKERFVGTPSMSRVVAHLGEEIGVRYQVAITSVAREEKQWWLTHDDGREGPFDVVLFAVPAPQLVTLTPEAGIRDIASRATYRPVWTLMVSLRSPVDTGWDSLKLEHETLGWIARNECKPGRSQDPALVVHGESRWSNAHLEDDREDVRAALLPEVLRVVGIDEAEVESARAHRWRYAFVETPLGRPCIWDERGGMGACGDWALGARVEDAFLSGVALAGRVLGFVRDAA